MRNGAIKDHNITVIEKSREEEAEAQFRPLQWNLIRRLFSYTGPVKKKMRLLVMLVICRAGLLPAMVYISSSIISGPIASGNKGVLPLAVLGFALVAVLTEG